MDQGEGGEEKSGRRDHGQVHRLPTISPFMIISLTSPESQWILFQSIAVGMGDVIWVVARSSRMPFWLDQSQWLRWGARPDTRPGKGH